MVSVMLIFVLNIKVTCDIKPLNRTTKTLALMSSLSLGFEVLYAGRLTVPYLVMSELPCINLSSRSLHEEIALPGLRSG